MKASKLLPLLGFSAGLQLSASPLIAQENPTAEATPASEENASEVRPFLSLQLELEDAIDKGIAYLLEQQNDDGSWSLAMNPAFTALSLTAIYRDPDGQAQREERQAALDAGLKFLLSKQQDSGAISEDRYMSYNTALSIMALIAAEDEALIPAIRKARGYLIANQADYGVKGVHETPIDGGIGYGSNPNHSDMSNTHLAMEALAYSRQLLQETEEGLGQELDWEAALDFVTHTQNLPQTNTQPWVSAEASERGGFMYYPGNSKAGEVPGTQNGAQRSYGSMTYAGLLAFLYAEVDQDDIRVQSALDWLNTHYTLEENPRMGMQGYYYYLHTMAKALRAAQVTNLTTPDGKKHPWRQELAVHLMNLQKPDGSWINEDQSRWMEDNPVLVTCYAVLALQHIHAALN